MRVLDQCLESVMNLLADFNYGDVLPAQYQQQELIHWKLDRKMIGKRYSTVILPYRHTTQKSVSMK